GAQARHLPYLPVHRTLRCWASSSQRREPFMSFVFLASQCRRRLPADPPSRGRPCLGLVVILMYLALMKVNLLQGTYTPLTHAHAGRTQSAAADALQRPLRSRFRARLSSALGSSHPHKREEYSCHEWLVRYY